MNKNTQRCKNDNCNKPATHALVSDNSIDFYCEADAHGICQLDNLMGFGLPRTSVRPMTQDEMLINNEDEK